LVFHIRGGGIGGGTVGLAPFDENFEGRTLKNIDSFGKYRPKVFLTFSPVPTNLYGLPPPLHIDI